MVWKKYFDMFYIFFKLSAFGLGAASVTIPLIENEVIDKKQWIEREEFIDMVAIAQSAPGPITIKIAVFVGYKVAGVIGSTIATIAVIIAPVIIMIIITRFFIKFQTNKYLNYAFLGLRPVTVGLTAAAAITIAQSSIIDYKSIFICLTAFFTSCKLKIDPLLFILISGIVGYILY